MHQLWAGFTQMGREMSVLRCMEHEKHGINMTAISEISKLSWRAIENDYSLDQY